LEDKAEDRRLGITLREAEMDSKGHRKGVPSASLRPLDWLRFVQIDPFPGQWNRLKLGERALEVLEFQIISAPRDGVVVPEAGGLRKLRFAAPASEKGKSGSYRVFYVYFPEYGIVVLWAVIDKVQKANLTKAQRNAIALQIARLRRLLDEGAIR
jgi:hypothetical protein